LLLFDGDSFILPATSVSPAFAWGLQGRADCGSSVEVDLIYSVAVVAEAVKGGGDSDLILEIATAISEKP
jgi:hypothetical protein